MAGRITRMRAPPSASPSSRSRPPGFSASASSVSRGTPLHVPVHSPISAFQLSSSPDRRRDVSLPSTPVEPLTEPAEASDEDPSEDMEIGSDSPAEPGLAIPAPAVDVPAEVAMPEPNVDDLQVIQVNGIMNHEPALGQLLFADLDDNDLIDMIRGSDSYCRRIPWLGMTLCSVFALWISRDGYVPV